MITHDMTEAILLADRIAVMRAGRLLAQAPPAQLPKNTDVYVANSCARRGGRPSGSRLLPRDGAA